MKTQEGQEPITLKMEGDIVLAEKFIKALGTFYHLLKEVSKDVVGEERGRVMWGVSVQSGSTIVMFEPVGERLSSAVKAKNALVHGLEEIEKGTDKRPPHFSHRAMDDVYDLGRLFDAKREPGARVVISGDHLTVRISQQSAATAEKFIGERHESEGSIEGRLQVLSAHKKFSYEVYGDLRDRAIKCDSLKDKTEELRKKALEAFDRRVSVRGTIRYSDDGYPVSILVREIEILPDNKELPTLKDVQSIFERP